MKVVNVLLFADFTTLDAMGPAEIFSRLERIYSIDYFSINGGLVSSSTNTKIQTKKFEDITQSDIVLIPGGWGTRQLVNDTQFIGKLYELAQKSENVLCVCTGSALLAKTGLLDNRNATSNKIAWEWVTAQNEKVNWIKNARWVTDGKYYTSSGITAGIDMCLGFVSDKIDYETARKISSALEYVWNENKDSDPFCTRY
jgi:transcriptional regulator GlxA family with amidase domain